MVLSKIQKILEDAHFPGTLIPPGESFPQESLLISVGLDKKQKERTIQIAVFPQQLDNAIAIQPTSEKYYRVQFMAPLPSEATNSALNQTASLILFLNQLLDWPGFELNELTNKISYRTVWLAKESAIDSHQILTFVGNILLSLDMFGETIEQIASGKMTFNDLLSGIINLSQNLNKT